MKSKFVPILLIASLVLNILLYHSLITEKKDPVLASMGVSDVFEILFEEIESFDDAHHDLQNGTINQEQFNQKIKATSKNVARLAAILDGYQFLPYQLSEALYELEDYFYSFDSYSEALKISSFEEIKETVKKNSTVQVAQYYQEYPNFLEGDIPPEMRQLLSDFHEIAEKVKNN